MAMVKSIEPPSGRRVAREAALIAGAILAYFGVRNLTAGDAGAAFENARRIVRLERAAALDVEGAVQGAIVEHDWLVTLANWVYIWGHWPVILSIAVGLFFFRRERYYVLRNALFLSGAIGFLFFALFPSAPPRLLDAGLVDTVTSESSSYRALQPPGLTNQYAAFPSLHAGWNLLVGIVLFTATSSRLLRVLCVLGPASMVWAVVATANHFVVDVVAGLAIVLAALAVVELARRREAATVVGRGHAVAELVVRAARRRPPSRQLPRRAPGGRAARSLPRRG